MNAIFVYGLLKPGFSLHHIAAPFVLRAIPATARGRLYDAGVPAARFDEDGIIEGFVLFIDGARLDEALAVLDDLEDEGSTYRRVPIEVSTAGGRLASHAYHYLHPVNRCPPVGPLWPAHTPSPRGSSIV